MKTSGRKPAFPGTGRRLLVVLALATLVLATAGGVYMYRSSCPAAQAREEAEAASPPSIDYRPLDYTFCEVQSGDTLSGIAARYGLRVDSIVSVNGIKDARAVPSSAKLKIPNQDGLLYTVQAGDSLESIAARYSLSSELLRQVNRAGDLSPGQSVFLPGARMDADELQRINGDVFIWPARGPVSSSFGARDNPFTGERSFHHGVDLAVSWGTAVGAARAGTVLDVGHDDPSLGNYVVLAHGSGYDTYYFHLSSIAVRHGQRVAQGQMIGRVGDTGGVTGTHLHFGISRYGVYFNPVSVVGKHL